MGNNPEGAMNQENIKDDFEQTHNISKHFEAKSNFQILQIGHCTLSLTKRASAQLQNDPTKLTSSAKESTIKEITSTENLQSQGSPVIQESSEEQQEVDPVIYKNVNTIDFTEFIEFKKTKVTDTYVFHGRIDGGSFGDVYKASLRKAYSDDAKEYRAIKAIPESKANQAIFKEINMLRKLDHPSILKIYEVYRYNKMFYIVTEFLPGGNLMQLTTKGSKYSEMYVAAIMKELMSGLVYLHSNNIIHRDIKPQNIVFETKPVLNKSIASESKKKIAHSKLIDFGISIIKEEGKGVSGSVGTPYFMAPEVMVGVYDEKCDIWSCGVMLYFLLCGSLPFKGSNSTQIFNQILYNKPLFSQKEWHHTSKSAVSLIKNMLNKNKNQRFSAKEVLQSEWMKNKKTDTIKFDQSTLSNLQTRGFQDSFTAIVKTYIASMTSSVAQRRVIADKFMEIDKDKSGFIDKEQLTEAFQQMGIPCTNIDQVLDKVDTNKSGKIDFTQFLTVMTNQETMMAKERLTQAFDFLDSDGTGYIEFDEIMQVLKNSNQDEVSTILSTFDQNGDNKISKDEFIQTMLKCSNGNNIFESSKTETKVKKTRKASNVSVSSDINKYSGKQKKEERQSIRTSNASEIVSTNKRRQNKQNRFSNMT